ncbi:GATA transcription factor 19-like isoform X2 [Salvia hispanica]|uniref:GATA transcription factor 19-like isoform X2 n=1 Tax=Salvia hispanica TaxID=49212 RepID=UPI0020096194|nr:GATA transcription factor 19-like isoform X2 [Salvia hispanica]
MPFEYASMPIRVHENGGGFDISSRDLAMVSTEEISTAVNSQSLLLLPPTARTSELTISFQGQLYVFPAVTPEKVEAVLLLLGGREMPTSIPSSELLLQINDKGVDDDLSQPTVSRRIASLLRFREKRKERCFDKKMRYSCRKEVAQRKMVNLLLLRICPKYLMIIGIPATALNQYQCDVHRCQHCGVWETSTPAMRRGPEGPRTLCNACGLMWANKGTLRDLAKEGEHVFEQNELVCDVFESLECSPHANETTDSYCNQDEELIGITERIADDSAIGIEHQSANLGEQDDVDQHVGAQWPAWAEPYHCRSTQG